MKKRYIISFLLVICIICNLFGVQLTRAWFVAGGTVGYGEYETAKVQYLPELEPDDAQKGVYGAFIDTSTAETAVYLVPGDEIVKPFHNADGTSSEGKLSIENFSTVDTNVRVNVDVVFQDENGNAADMSLFSWQQTGDSTYEYGIDVDVNGTSVHMGLLQVVFSAATASTTVAPGYIPPAGDATPYRWLFRQEETPAGSDRISFENTWELTLGGGSDIPAVQKDRRRMYNVIDSVKIVGTHPIYQEEFNTYFSNNYAGKKIVLTISYYAKQLMGMEWNMFTRSVFTADTPAA